MTYVCIGVPYALGQLKIEASVDSLKASGIADELGAAWVDLQPDFTSHANPVVVVNRAMGRVLEAELEK